MATDYVSDHEHELDAEYLHRSDAALLSIEREGEELHVDLAVPCPECGQTLGLTAVVATVSELDLDLPLEDAEELYD